MQRPLFSASHSAKLLEHRYAGRGGWPQDAAKSTYWVQRGVTAHGEVWGMQSEAGSETTVGEFDGGERDEDDDDCHRALDGVEVREQRAENAENASSHAHHHTEDRHMTVKTYWWISLWFLITVPVIFWDASYCFLRPRSMKGGDLHWIWSPYALYQEIDYVYGIRAYENGEGFTNAQSALNLVENFMNMAYLWLAHVSRSPLAPLVGFSSVVMTLSKTVLYWLQEYYCGGCSVGHNDFTTLFIYWVVPNGLWLLVPSFILARLGGDIAASLRTTEKAQKKKAAGKNQ